MIASCQPSEVHTNIIVVEVNPDVLSPEQFCERMSMVCSFNIIFIFTLTHNYNYNMQTKTGICISNMVPAQDKVHILS